MVKNKKSPTPFIIKNVDDIKNDNVCVIRNLQGRM